ncbi:hypothetical protein LINPERPRIM_LOCUS22201 [Linum perenne]
MTIVSDSGSKKIWATKEWM